MVGKSLLLLFLAAVFMSNSHVASKLVVMTMQKHRNSSTAHNYVILHKIAEEQS